jgi:uncharacterized protein with von Willebrand factor type A (vWA) domain
VDEHAILTALFERLRRSGIPLGTRDYLDALRALDEGFGIGDRAELRWLCEAVWSRRESDTRVIRAVFDALPSPTAEELKRLTPEVEPDQPGAVPPAPQPGGAAMRAKQPLETPDQDVQDVPVEFVTEAEAGTRNIPVAEVAPGPVEAFVLTEAPIVTVRDLVIAWRRFRKPLRCGPGVIVDIDATVRRQCRTGLLTEIAMIAARRNQASLVVLMDVSASMLPWRSFNAAVRESLRESQLAAARVFYFSNAPADVLYEDEEMLKPQSMQHLLAECGDSGLLVMSDAGAARGNLSQRRIEATRSFLDRVKRHWAPAAWLNPMPERRWRRTSAEAIGAMRGVSMFHLSDDGVIAAIDCLRGYAESAA